VKNLSALTRTIFYSHLIKIGRFKFKINILKYKIKIIAACYFYHPIKISHMVCKCGNKPRARNPVSIFTVTNHSRKYNGPQHLHILSLKDKTRIKNKLYFIKKNTYGHNAMQRADRGPMQTTGIVLVSLKTK
jgi:hypothetical protein